MPDQCRGVVLERKQDKDAQPAIEEQQTEDGDAEAEQIGAMQVTAEFDEMVVWGHEAVADSTGDPYVRSMEEWLQVADLVNSYTQGDETPQK
ncbi:hypothetical protein ACJ41O_000974 [Fusarium nematophilum]